MRIPGLGCLKGCLTMIVLVVVLAWLVWNFTPLQDWVAEGKSFYDATTGWIKEAWKWVEDLGGLAERTGQSS